MCDRTHTYTVEIVGQMSRYSGPDESAAISALLGTADSETGEDGCVTAEHEDGSTCPAEGDRIADAAEAALAERDAQAAQQGSAGHFHAVSDPASWSCEYAHPYATETEAAEYATAVNAAGDCGSVTVVPCRKAA